MLEYRRAKKKTETQSGRRRHCGCVRTRVVKRFEFQTERNLCQTVKKIIRFVQKTFEIEFSRSGMCALLN